MFDDGVTTVTSLAQHELEERILQLYRDYGDEGFDEGDPALILTRKQHAKYLSQGLGELPPGFIALDASRTWICYWVTHALALLGAPLPKEAPKQQLVAFLASCQHPEGGFGGGPYQLAHLAPTYAAVAALVTLGGEEALGVIDRSLLWSFLLRMCVPPSQGGGMTMHEGGEVDVRGCYCALAVCHMLQLDMQALAEACAMVDYIKACQSYEGGLGGEPWNEGHGGYTFCGLAALMLLGRAEALDIPRLLHWAARCQGSMEGGFMGRTNKLVDGCYSYWQGAAFPLLQQLLEQQQNQQPHDLQQARQAQQVAKRSSPSNGGGAPLGDPAEQAAAAAAVAAVTEHLLSGAAEAFVDGLPPALAPVEVAQTALAQAQQLLDDVVDRSLQADERVKAAVQSHQEDGRQLEQEAAELLEQAGEVQKSVERAVSELEVARCSAAALLHAATTLSPGANPAVEQQQPQETPPQLFNARALQLWVLKCCQGPRGGLRDKPGKPPDYYHSCYCLSGLSAAQRYSGSALGGSDNLLLKADPLCNVVEERLEEALEYFKALPVPT
ncbi:hypothetical protein N2152v2_010320 [Parachlorella kessleri]